MSQLRHAGEQRRFKFQDHAMATGKLTIKNHFLTGKQLEKHAKSLSLSIHVKYFLEYFSPGDHVLRQTKTTLFPPPINNLSSFHLNSACNTFNHTTLVHLIMDGMWTSTEEQLHPTHVSCVGDGVVELSVDYAQQARALAAEGLAQIVGMLDMQDVVLVTDTTTGMA